MKRLFRVEIELDTEAPDDPLYQRNRPGLDLGEDAIYVQLNGILECTPNLRVTSVRELSTAADEDDDDGCPKGDPECLGRNGDCHDACENPL